MPLKHTTTLKYERKVINMNTIKKELLALNKHAFQEVNAAFGIDFQKPYTIFKHEGSFTVKQLLKKVDNPDNAVIAAYVKKSSCVNWLDIVRIYPTGNYDIMKDDRSHRSNNGKMRYLSHFYAKTDFESTRKQPGVITYVIYQDRSNLSTAGKRYFCDIDYNERYTLHKDNYRNGIHTRHYADNITMIEVENGMYKTTFNHYVAFSGGYDNLPTNIYDVIDKSGYIVNHKRQVLKDKAASIRSEKEKAAFLDTDYTDKVKTLELCIEKRKKDIETAFSKATTEEEVQKVIDMLDKWHTGYRSIIHEYDHFKKMVSEKAYNSIAAADKAYNYILGMLGV